MGTIAVWIVFGLVYGLVTWLATRRNPRWWYIGLVFVSGVFGIIVILIGIIVRIVKAIILAAGKSNQIELSPEEVKVRSKKMSVYVPVIFAVVVAAVFAGLYLLLGMDLHYIFRNFIKIIKGFL